tara:strand:+ start:48 stop:281 length:234 start_codon:yes stop_codon:yes gene_type:complete
MKDKIVTLKVNGASQGQYSSLLLELNLMKKEWKSAGVEIKISAPGLKNILSWGTKINEYVRNRQSSKSVESNKRSKV